LNQRIQKTVGSTITKSFFNEKWQEIESITNNQVTSYIWGLRYIDDLVLREKGAERLYSLADPNWNVISICNSTGSIVERMKYDAFGKITWLDINFSTKNKSDYGWNRIFTGQVLDAETYLLYYRYRYYNVDLGCWITRDPIEYRASDYNVYRYLNNKAILLTDPLGLRFINDTTGCPFAPAGESKSCSEQLASCNAGVYGGYAGCMASIVVGYGFLDVTGCVAGCGIRFRGQPQSITACTAVCTFASTLITLFLTATICEEASLMGEMRCGNNYNRCTLRTDCCDRSSNSGCDNTRCENWRP
jgi:RHS repeat-associated protein